MGTLVPGFVATVLRVVIQAACAKPGAIGVVAGLGEVVGESEVRVNGIVCLYGRS